MAANKTSLSTGEIIYSLLSNDAEVKSKVTKIFPVASDKAELPYIVYRRAGFIQTPVKKMTGADELAVEVVCYTAKYAEGVELAEAVRTALDNVKAENEALTMRSCILTDAEEAWQDDAYIQQLVFTIKI